jgi:hypothetical protein
MKVVWLSALHTDLLYTPANILIIISVRGEVDFRARKIRAMKNLNDLIGNQTHDFPACSAVPQSTAPLAAPSDIILQVLKYLPSSVFAFILSH